MTWLVFVEADTDLSDVNIPFDCEFLVAQQALENVTLSEVYRVSPSHPLQYHQFATWSPGEGLVRTSSSLYRRRNNLQGMILKTGFKKVGFIQVYIQIIM